MSSKFRSIGMVVGLVAINQANAEILSEVDLTDGVTAEEVTITGHMITGEQKAVETQRNAANILNAINSDGIGKLPDRNAAEAVQRAPGVSIARDQGEGRFVAVRGAPPQWSSTTLNGDRIPTAEEETTSRATAFDFFPSELIERVEVSKALTPNLEGDAIGGNVNFITATSPKSTLLNVSLAGNHNEKNGASGYSGNIVYGDRTDDGKFGFLVNATYWERPWATDNFEERRGDDGLGIFRLELRDYTGVRTTEGLNVAAEYNPSEGNKFYFRSQHGELNDDETHYKHRLRFDKNRIELQHIFNTLITDFNMIEVGGVHEVDNSKFDWKIGSADNKFHYGCTPNCKDNSYFVVRFDEKNVGFTGLTNYNGKLYSYNEIDGGTSNENSPSTHLPANFRMDATKTVFSSVELYKIAINERDRMVAQLNFETEISDDLTFKAGAKYRKKERSAVYADEFYTWRSGAVQPPKLFDFQLSDQPGRTNYNVGSSYTYSDYFSKVMSLKDAKNWFAENKDKLELDVANSELIENGGALGRNFNIDESQSALYAMGTWKPSEKISLVGGVRLENTETQVSGKVYDQKTKAITPSTDSKEYLSILPSMHVTYLLNEDSDLRLALSRSFARPDFGDLNSGGSFLEADNRFTSGNPKLNPTYSNNLDFMYSYYFQDKGVVSAGLFYKNIIDPIFDGTDVGNYGNNTGVIFSHPKNGQDASIKGAEFSLNRQFDFLPGELRYFGINTNATIMSSSMNIPDREKKTSVPGQSDLLYNVALYFDNAKFAARLAVNYKGASIDEFGTSEKLDVFYGKNRSVDLTTTYQFNSSLTAFLELNNLTDEPLLYYFGDPKRPSQKEFYGIRGQAGIKYSFY